MSRGRKRLGPHYQNNKWLKHYGMPRRSGRYPWGSGKQPQRNRNTYNVYRQLHKEGYSDKEIAASWNMSINKLVALKAIGQKEERAIKVERAEALKAKGYSNMEIGRRMGIRESSVRSLLDKAKKDRNEQLFDTAKTLADFCDKHKYVDVGAGTEIALGVKGSKMKTALEMLQNDGYSVHNVFIDQMGTNHQTTVKCLVPPGTSYKDLQDHKYDIVPVHDTVINGELGIKMPGPLPVNNVSSSRIAVKYAEDGGTDRDGTMFIRRGVADLDLGAASYAQVRIGVDGTHYCKGMVAYGTDEMFANVPKGVDIIVNSNKKRGTPILGEGDSSVLKQQKVDPANPFKASIKDDDDLEMVQKYYKDPKTGEQKLSALNIVNEEGDWDKWSKTLSSQFLSKQYVDLAKSQLNLKYREAEEEFEQISKLENPALKRVFLEKFAEGCDAAAVDLKAAALPKQATKVILPVPSLKDNEIYAPHLEDGTRVVLIRHPHASTSEIPQLVVNNKNKEGIAIMGKHPTDAVGIPPKAAQQLSGADFDGDSVLVIPANNPGGKVRIKTQPQFKDLIGFDTSEYKLPSDRKDEVISHAYMQKQMGIVSNLITDMTLQKAPEGEMVRAIKHSMVIIDSEKHELDWKKSKRENRIDELVAKYQRHIDPETGEVKIGGASTIISKAKSKYVEPEIKENTQLVPYHYSEKEGKYVGNVDPNTGELIKRYTGRSYTTLKVETSDGKKRDLTVYTNKDGRHFTIDPETKERKYHSQMEVEDEGKVHGKTHDTTKMEAAKDAFTLTSGGSRDNPGHPMEAVYANYANQQKALANKARLEFVNTKPSKVDPQAKAKYKKEYDEIAAMIKQADSNAPLERRAQILANKMVDAEKLNDPYMSYDTLKKLKGRSISLARKAVGAKKFKADDVTDEQWKAIQEGGIPTAMQEKLFNIVELDALRERAMSRQNKMVVSEAKKAKIKALSANYTQAEIAELVGMSASQVSKIINGQ